ncbi:MAG: hypothetical protein IKC51_06215 [Myxococcaceae bacterium]|nr:hypothetical protein [Myxococcaceae bacterium]
MAFKSKEGFESKEENKVKNKNKIKLPRAEAVFGRRARVEKRLSSSETRRFDAARSSAWFRALSKAEACLFDAPR